MIAIPNDDHVVAVEIKTDRVRLREGGADVGEQETDLSAWSAFDVKGFPDAFASCHLPGERRDF